jgi:hypothetical protein
VLDHHRLVGSAGRVISLPPTRKPRSASVLARIVPASRCVDSALSIRAVATMTTCGTGGIVAISDGDAMAAKRDLTSGIATAEAAATPIPANANAGLLRPCIFRPPRLKDAWIIVPF